MSAVPSVSQPLVSVIVPAFNAEAFIETTLKSVLAQTYERFEIIVVDDGSTDRTVEIVQQIATVEPRIRLVHQPNQGVASARNLGIQLAQGEFVAPLDADDIWFPSNLERQVACMVSSGTQVGVVYAWSLDIDEHDTLIGGFRVSSIQGDVFKTLLCHNFLGNASASLIRKACLSEVGGYDEQMRAQQAQGCEDWDLYLRLAERYEFRVVPEFLVGYRKTSSSMSGDFRTMAASQDVMLKAVQRKHPEISSSLYRLSRSSFYLYLAQQSYRYGNYENTLFWLRRAVAVDPVTPCLRPGLYVLMIKSMVNLKMSRRTVNQRMEERTLGDSQQASVSTTSSFPQKASNQ